LQQQASSATVTSGGWWDRMKQFTATSSGPHENIPQLKQVSKTSLPVSL